MNSVMISIKPEWCALIASGEKTAEVRKTKPCGGSWKKNSCESWKRTT